MTTIERIKELQKEIDTLKNIPSVCVKHNLGTAKDRHIVTESLNRRIAQARAEIDELAKEVAILDLFLAGV